MRDVLGRSAPVDCRIVRRSSPIINLLFTPCTLKKEISPVCRRSGGFIRASPYSNGGDVIEEGTAQGAATAVPGVEERTPGLRVWKFRRV